jgi:hypothetical protein
MEANPANSGVLSFSTDALTTGSGRLTYNGGGAGLGGADITGGLTDPYFGFEVLSVDLGGIELTVTVSDGTISDSATLELGGVGVSQLAFSAFSGSADFTSIEGVELDINVPISGGDLTLDSFFTSGHITPVIPEPSTLAIWGVLGGLGLIAARRRRKAA